MANPDDVVPDLPALPPGSEFLYLEGRFHEIFAPVNEADIPRAARFGERRSYPDGAMLFEVGKPAPGMFVLLSGRVAFSRRDALGRSIPIWERAGAGHFLGEVGQLSGADALVDVQARGPVEALLLPPAACGGAGPSWTAAEGLPHGRPIGVLGAFYLREHQAPDHASCLLRPGAVHLELGPADRPGESGPYDPDRRAHDQWASQRVRR